MTVKNPVPARLFVLLAREAPVGVILRRGPSKWVQLIKWNTESDTFEAGQWFRGRVFEYSGDLSPDGRLFFYIAHKRDNQQDRPDYSDGWMAVSKPPYFTALALWPIKAQPDGHFIDNSTLQLYGRSNPHPDHLPSELNVVNDNPDGFTSFPYHDAFLAHHGWTPTGLFSNDGNNEHLSWAGYDREKIRWVKNLPSSHIRAQWRGFRVNIPGGALNHFNYTFVSNNQDFALQGANWADFDQQGRLVLAKDGKIFSAEIQNNALQLTELADFNANQHEPVETPDWAKKW